ncbi:hypothetical protein TWF730_003627 [Orbilia blumenaviensis]|uniref:BTB domain-containing protein n=1 Tax=Orbilia blumenaviensis TaxID=1796055 RepID=A0AAV9U5D6_9PEZI
MPGIRFSDFTGPGKKNKSNEANEKIKKEVSEKIAKLRAAAYVPKPKKVEYEPNNLKILDDPETYDAIIFAGRDKKPFKVHEEVICVSSGYYREACSTKLEEGQKREIYVPEVRALIIERVLHWQYSTGLEYLPDLGPEAMLIWRAADFLDMPDFKRALLTTLYFFLVDTFCKLEAPLKRVVYDNFLEICTFCTETHYPVLTDCAWQLSLHFHLDPMELVDDVLEGYSSRVFLAVMIAALQRLRSSNVCTMDLCMSHGPVSTKREVGEPKVDEPKVDEPKVDAPNGTKTA